MMLLKCCTQYASKFGKLTGLEKVSFHSNPKERQCQRMFKLSHNSLISHASKVMLKIFQARLQQYMNHELPDVQAGFRKGRETRDQIANIHWIIEKAREFQKKHLLLLYWLHWRLWLCRSQQTGSSVFFKSNLYIWKFSVHILLKPSLENFEH